MGKADKPVARHGFLPKRSNTGVRTFFHLPTPPSPRCGGTRRTATPSERLILPSNSTQVGVQPSRRTPRARRPPSPGSGRTRSELPKNPRRPRCRGCTPGRHRARGPYSPQITDPPQPSGGPRGRCTTVRALPPGREGVEQRPVGERGRGPGADPPAGGRPSAVHHGAQVDLAGGRRNSVTSDHSSSGAAAEVPRPPGSAGPLRPPPRGSPPCAAACCRPPRFPPPASAGARPSRTRAARADAGAPISCGSPVAAALLEQLPHPPAQGGVLWAREPPASILITSSIFSESGDLGGASRSPRVISRPARTFSCSTSKPGASLPF